MVNEKINLQQLAKELAERKQMPQKKAEAFLREFFDAIIRNVAASASSYLDIRSSPSHPTLLSEMLSTSPLPTSRPSLSTKAPASRKWRRLTL